jgi:hypothetical protein
MFKQYLNWAVNNRLDIHFGSERVRVTSHDMRRLYAHMAYTAHCPDKNETSESTYTCLVLGHEDDTFSSLAYTTVVLV